MTVIKYLLVIFIGAGMVFQKEPVPELKRLPNAFVPVQSQLKSGDIVLRSGKGFISDVFRKTSTSQTSFSHAGVIVEESGLFYVYHMLGNSEKKISGLRKDKLSDFCNSNENTGFAIYRYTTLSGKEEKLQTYLDALSSKEPVFDEAFDLNTENALYCTELIYKSVLACSGFELPMTTIKGMNYVGLDNLYLNKHSIKITEVNY